MPPVASPVCKLPECSQPRHVYPGGYRSQYCRQHTPRRKAARREGFDSMTGQMLDVLRYLRAMQQQERDWCELAYPLAHGKTINHLLQRDWIFESPGPDGTRYKITGRGLQALKAYETPAQRRDGLCPRCGENERHVSSSGRRVSYCLACERARAREKRQRQRQQPGLCKKCRQRPKHRYSSGLYCDLCYDCERERANARDRKANRQLREAIRNGAPPPLCLRCKTRPVRVFANSVSSWCRECGRIETRKSKLRGMLRRNGLYEAAGD